MSSKERLDDLFNRLNKIRVEKRALIPFSIIGTMDSMIRGDADVVRIEYIIDALERTIRAQEL